MIQTCFAKSSMIHQDRTKRELQKDKKTVEHAKSSHSVTNDQLATSMSNTLETFRQEMLADVKAFPDNYAPEEVALIETNDWWLLRFLEFHKEMDKAKTLLKKAAKYRKDNSE